MFLCCGLKKGGNKIELRLRKYPFHELDKRTVNLLVIELKELGYKCDLLIYLTVEW